MSPSWTISADWEPLDTGSPEERACFAALEICANGVCLTEGNDALVNRLRRAPLLSAYHLAEWMAWNWWRLRWEPRSKAADWVYAHRLATIGGGYIWPNLTIFSDGNRISLLAESTDQRSQTPFRYITDRVVVLPATVFESELDHFIDQVLERLDSEKVANTNLEQVWNGVREERRNPELRSLRKLEALLGKDPDESDPEDLSRLVADAEQLSISAIEELAAECGQSGRILWADNLHEIANDIGFQASPRDAVSLPPDLGLPRYGENAAWHLGAQFARALRDQERLHGEHISDERLANMAGVKPAVLSDRRGSRDISFALDENINQSRVVLRSKWHEGRRFELARLLGDRLAGPKGGRLFPATRSYTYRQKMQRSFAAEFLSPFEAVDEMLEDNYSVENQKDVAEHFKVSEITIRTLLVNHGRLEREDLVGEFEVAAA